MADFPFSKRTDWLSHSNALNDTLEQLRAAGTAILDLTESNPTRGVVHYPSLLNAFDSTENYNYIPDSKGLPSARAAVAAFYRHRGIALNEDHIVLTASTSEAYSFLFRLLVNEGERVLIPRPSYPLFQFLLEINDAGFEYYPLKYEGQWRMDREAIEEMVDSKTRAIVVVNPNNPTGSYINSDDLAFLNDLCRKHHMAIISDEVFYDYALEQGDLRSCAGNAQALTFTLSGLSKVMALPQMKCGWILTSGPKEIVQEAISRLEIIADTYLSVNTPVQNALPQWLTHVCEIQNQIKSRVTANLRMVQKFASKNFEICTVQGGWYAIAKIPSVMTEEQWVLKFLREDHVLVHPGYFFDFEDEAYLVISLLTEPNTLDMALQKINTRIVHEIGNL